MANTKTQRTAKPRVTPSVTIDNDTQEVVSRKELPDYAALGRQLFIILNEQRSKFRDQLLNIFEQVGKDEDGYKKVAESYAACYANKDTAKNMKSVLMAIFKAYVANSDGLLNGVEKDGVKFLGINDDTSYYPDWRKTAVAINGKKQDGGKKKENLTDSERDIMTDKIEEYATPKDAEIIIDHSLGKLNGEMRFALIHKLMEATLADQHSEAIFKGWAGQHVGEVWDLLQRVYDARKQAAETTQAVKNNIPLAA